jgi:gluconate kinase
MKKILMLVGNFGVGKSSLINNKILDIKDEVLLQISKRWWVLGTTINGADSVSKFNKQDMMKKIEDARVEGIIIAGNYYCSLRDVKRLSKNNDVSIVYLNTTFTNNAKRIALRGGIINPTTYNQKLKAHISLMRNSKHIANIKILDNNRGLKAVKKDFDTILNQK